MNRRECFRNLAVIAVVAVQLSACGGGATPGGAGPGDDDLAQSNRFCHTIPPVSSQCQPCVGTSNPVLAFDANLATYSSMSPGGQSAYRGVSSVEQTAGSLAGVYFVLPNPAGITITLSTFLDGTQQEVAAPVSRQTPNDNCSGLSMVCEFSDGGESFVGMGTTLAYDEIRATISNSSSDEVLIYELCVR